MLVLLPLSLSRSKGRTARWQFWSLVFYPGSVASFKLGKRRAPYRTLGLEGALMTDDSTLFYSAVAAWGTWATVLCALVVVWAQNRFAKRLTCLQLFVQIAAQYDSADMQAVRRRMADRLLSDLSTLDVEDSLLMFFENLAILSRKHLLDKELMWNRFVFDVPRYWCLLRHYVEYSREKFGDMTMYEEFEQLSLVFSRQLRSPLGTRIVPTNFTDELLREFLQYESRIGMGR